MSRSGILNASLLVGALGVLLLTPVFVEQAYIRHLLIIAFIYAVVASNWDLSLGYGGVFNMAHVAFFGTGVYTCALLAKNVGVNSWLAMLLAGVAAVILAAIIWVPTLRLRGIYVILVTFAVSQLLLRLILSQNDLTGGAKGMVFIPPLKIGDYSFSTDGKLGYYYVSLAILVLSTLFLRFLVKGPYGLAMVAIRDLEDYAISRGVSIARQRILVLAASAFFTGCAGGLYTLYLRVASPEVFGFDFLTLILSMVLLGGLATIYGPIFGAVLLLFVSEAMFDWGAWRYLVIGVLTIGLILFFPGGLAGMARQALSFGPRRDALGDSPSAKGASAQT